MPFSLNRGICRVSGGGQISAGQLAALGTLTISGGGAVVVSGVKQFLFRGELSFLATSYQVQENDTIQIPVTRQNGSDGAITVDWSLNGTSHNQSGQLAWGDGDPFDKQININVGGVSTEENGTVTLSNPTGGAILVPPTSASLAITLTPPSISTIPPITIGQGQFHDISQYINDPHSLRTATAVLGTSSTSYNAGTEQLEGVSVGVDTGLILEVTW